MSPGYNHRCPNPLERRADISSTGAQPTALPILDSGLWITLVPVHSATRSRLDSLHAMGGDVLFPSMSRSCNRFTTLLPCSRLAMDRSDAASATWMWNPASRLRRHGCIAPSSCRQCERRVEPWKSPRSRPLPSPDCLQESRNSDSPDALFGRPRALAIRNFVEGSCATRSVCGLRDARQASGNRAGARMMVEYRGGSVPDAVDHRHHGAQVDVVQVQHLIQAPPQPLQDLHEVVRRLVLQRHPASKRAVQMHMRVDQSGHDEPTPRIQKLRRRILLPHRRRSPHLQIIP